MKKKKFVLIDGNAYIHRAYHAIPRLTDASGNTVNAVYGFLKMIKKIIAHQQPSHILVAFDNPKPTFRHKDFIDYKSTRKKTDSELTEQFPKVFAILRALNIKFIDCEGFEADDIIASCVRLAQAENMQVSIVTGDKDMLQLISGNVKVINDMKKIDFDEAKVKEEIGVFPNQIIDYLALIGDKSDNLPGVRGIGPVTALKLLNKFSNLDEIYSNVNKIDEKTAAKLKNFKEDGYMTRRLVTLVKNMDLSITVDDCLRKEPNINSLRKELIKLNFRNILFDWVEIDKRKEADIPSALIITDSKILKNYLNENKHSGADIPLEEVAVEIYFRDSKEILGIGISFDPTKVVYIPISHSYLGVAEQMDQNEIMEVFKKHLLNDNRKFIAYDLKNVYKYFKECGLTIARMDFDIITAEYILNADNVSKELKEVCARYIDMFPDEYAQNSDNVRIEDFAKLVSGRIVAIFKLKKVLQKKIVQQNLEKLFCEIEMPLAKILAEMELIGIKLDTEQMKLVKMEFKKKLRLIESEIFEIAGETFNINSSKQLANILFEKLGLNPLRKTKSGFSTAEDVLTELKSVHPLPETILIYRSLQKLLSTYILPLIGESDTSIITVNTTFNIAGTATGRLSSSNPNLQNIPVKTQDGCLIRKAFVPESEKIFLSADYSQIDLRALAHISGDENLTKSFNEGKDIHKITASKIFEVDEQKVTDKMRKKAKTINFGIVYGMSSWGLSKRADLTETEAKEFIEKYFIKYLGVKNYMEEIVSSSRELGYVTTILNRRRYIPEIKSSNFSRRKIAERMAINTPIQGSSADIIKAAMISLNKEFKFNNSKVKLLLQIHDELLFEVFESDLKNIIIKIKDKMENSIKLSVPLKVDFKKGKNWGELEEIRE